MNACNSKFHIPHSKRRMHNAAMGYAVDFVSEATLTFPMVHQGTGQTFSAQDITLRTELVLADRFARIVNVDTCLSGL